MTKFPVPVFRDATGRMSAELQEALGDALAEFVTTHIEYKILASGQIPCPRPHVNLFAGGRCYCGAEV